MENLDKKIDSFMMSVAKAMSFWVPILAVSGLLLMFCNVVLKFLIN